MSNVNRPFHIALSLFPVLMGLSEVPGEGHILEGGWGRFGEEQATGPSLQERGFEQLLEHGGKPGLTAGFQTMS